MSSTNSIGSTRTACRRATDRKNRSIAIPHALIGEAFRHPTRQQQSPSSDRNVFDADGRIEIWLNAWVEHRPAIHHFSGHPIW
jgi:hypothetical protein